MSEVSGDSTHFSAVHTYRGVPFDRRLPIRPTIIDCLIERSLRAPNDPFLSLPTADGSTVTVSYRKLETITRQLARWIRHDLGAGAGDVIALLPTNDIPSVFAIFAVMRTGCALLLLNPTDPRGRLDKQTGALGINIILRSPAVPDGILPSAHAVPDAATLGDVPTPEPGPDPFADALLFATSGSTATSKLVAQSHYNAAVNAEALRRHHGLSPGDRILGCLPIHHVNGVHFTLFATVTAGAHAILAPRFDALGYRRVVEQFRPRIASVVPSILEALVETWRQPSFPPEFEYFVSAAAPLTVATSRAVARKLGVRVLQGYGLTETTNFSTTMPLGLSDGTYERFMLNAEIPSIGQALYGNEITVLRADGTHAVVGEVGEICMRGHNVMMRYVGNIDATAEAFRDGWFHSQDLGFAVQDAASEEPFFVLTGRTKNIAKVGGESVSLDEMERVLRAIPGIHDAACVPLPHRFLGDQIVAVIVPAHGTGAVDVLPGLRGAFAPNVLPRRIVVLDAIPRTPTGKIRRTALAAQLAASGDEEERS